MHNSKVIARGMNATNISRNGTRHAEYMALSALLSSPPDWALSAASTAQATDPESATTNPESTNTNPNPQPSPQQSNFPDSPYPTFADDPLHVRLGHLYPYGQKLLPLRQKVSRSIVKECTLYVTVEPCVMCASMLRQLGIRKVYFGAVNDKFGGTGGVFRIHANSPPVVPGTASYAFPPSSKSKGFDADAAAAAVQAAPTAPIWRPMPPGEGDGGNVESGYPVEGGWGRDEAVGLLRRFYVQENGRGGLSGMRRNCRASADASTAPIPRKKEGRAARLAAIMAQDPDAPLPPELATHVAAIAAEKSEASTPERPAVLAPEALMATSLS